ncbi:MAG: hypothetical protein NZ551_01940 [Microscillaceae bacterium]|nr:hypothetical protein [Microscillaceae bacterium]MDW8459948.1 hypothetical protein [Cytophagales bacterium]
MGKLQFALLKIEKLSKRYIYIIGKWQLFRTQDSLQRHFTLLWKKINKQWVIISNHSSG